MTKVVINKCFGGFNLSEAGVEAYAARKGLTLYPEPDGFLLPTYWTVPAEQRPKELENWNKQPIEARKAYNAAYSNAMLSPREIPRDDADLVAVVEQLGAAVDGRHAKLAVVEVPGDVEWEIEEYDGRECVAEVHRSWG
jgi:hypothetical protein